MQGRLTKNERSTHRLDRAPYLSIRLVPNDGL